MMDIHEKVIKESKKLVWRQRVQLRPGINYFTENVLKTDVLVFEPGAELYIGDIDADYNAIIAKVIYIQDGRIPSLIRAARKDGEPGESGRDGVDGIPQKVDGEDGVDGTDATSAKRPPPFLMFCEEFSYGTSPSPGISALIVDAAGGDGAHGGNGGDGGNGRQGNKGWPGISVGPNQLCP